MVSGMMRNTFNLIRELWSVRGLIAIRGLAPSPALSFLLIDLHPWTSQRGVTRVTHAPQKRIRKDGAGRSFRCEQGQLQRVPADGLPEKADCDA